jgi:hypothetical protein
LLAPFRYSYPDTIIDIHLALLGLALPSPPQVVQPSLPTRTLFEQGLSDKLHNSLVINNKSQTKQCIKQTRDTLPSSSPATLVAERNKKAVQPLAPSHSCMPSLPMPNSGPSTVVSGSKEKKCILDKYVSKFGSGYQELIVIKKKGKLHHNELLLSLASSWQFMKPSTNKYYQVKELTIYNVITIVIRECVAFSKNELSNIRLLNTNFAKMIPKLHGFR